MEQDDGQHGPMGGELVPIPGGHAFVPDPLPPRITHTGVPDDEEAAKKAEVAMLEIGRLDMAGDLIGSAFAQVVPYLAREAVPSSGIEGISMGIADLLRRRALGVYHGPAGGAAVEVEANARALEKTLGMVDGGAPISLDLILRAHRILFEWLPRHASMMVPGEFRTAQSRIGGTSISSAAYVPPPPERVLPLMKNLVAYIEADTGPGSALERCAIAHAQFESIHPFPDGNGRVGRILILLMMRRYGLLGTATLNISRHLLERRMTYYDMLRGTRSRGGWARWIAFFADACAERARAGVGAMVRADSLRLEYRGRIAHLGLGDAGARVVDRLAANPYITAEEAAAAAGLDYGGASALAGRLAGAGILVGVSDGAGNDFYFAPEIVHTLLGGDTGGTGGPPPHTPKVAPAPGPGQTGP